MISVFADFNAMDGDGLIRLVSAGSMRDLYDHRAELREGVRVRVYDYDREAEGTLVRSGDRWAVLVDLRTYRLVDNSSLFEDE